jgi:hypothetical protein
MARWRVDILRKRSDHLGMVEADTEKEAIEKAIKLFNIGPELEFKITVQKAGSPRNKNPEPLGGRG